MAQPIPPAALRLAARWRADAAVLRRYGADDRAELVERLAAEMEAEMQAGGSETIGLEAAAELSGYSAAHVRRLLREGRLRNLGSARSPAFLADELPRKPGHVPPHTAPPSAPAGLSKTEIVRAVLRGE